MDTLTITLYNPNSISTSSIFRNNIWNASIKFKKNGSTLYKDIEENNTETFIKKIIEAIEKEETI